MDTEKNSNIYEGKLRRYLIQTGRREITGMFTRDGEQSYETNEIPAFNNFVQVICKNKTDCKQILEFTNIKYSHIHEVVSPFFIDGMKLHGDLFTNIPPHLKN
tara:strand:- start:6039 stop:6347 length:309 start_codon:yes stop_codon:yes gene_type:complete